MTVKPGRNDPCPCGSGRKYKACHGALPATGAPAHPAAPLDPVRVGRLVALLQAGRAAEAEQGARQALDAYPDQGILWKVLSVAQLRQGKDALPALRRAVDLLPADAEALQNLGTALHERGDWAGALPVLERVLARDARQSGTWIEMGDALRGVGRAAEAVEAYGRALALEPASAEAFNNLGNAYLQLGRHADAERHYRQALERRPGDPVVQSNLAGALRALGELEPAADLVGQALARAPALAAAHNCLGMIRAAQGAPEAAEAAFREALRHDPRLVDALNNLGNLLRDRGERREALATYARAVETDPSRPESHTSLGNVLFELRRVEEALACHRRALALNPRHAPAHLGVAYALRQQRKPVEAEAACRAALEADPAYVEALAFLGELQADRGDFAGAETLFRQAIARRPGYAFAYASIAVHRRMTAEDAPWREAAEGLLRQGLPLRDQISLSYALGKYHDDRGEYDDAFARYRDGNELSKRYGARYDPARLSARIDRIVQSVERLRAQPATPAPDAPLPVLVLGMPRSGTSLIEQILASHPQVFGAGEVTWWSDAWERWRQAEDAGRADRALLGRLSGEYLRTLRAFAPDSPRIVDKLPANFLFAGFIHEALPAVRLLHVLRNPLDTALSIYFQNFFNIGPWANDLEDLAHYYGEYRRIMRHWRASLPAGALLEVPYEGLVAEPETWARRMIDFVGLPWDPRCLEFHRTDRVVITASKWQVRQRISSGSVGRWRHYAQHLGPLRRLESMEA